MDMKGKKGGIHMFPVFITPFFEKGGGVSLFMNIYISIV